MPWAVKWRSNNSLDGKREYLVGKHVAHDHIPLHMRGYKTAVFETREIARAFIKERYGYIATSPDLKHDPHGWKMPVAVKVSVEVKEV